MGALADQGIGVASLANNHVSDFGPPGVLDTMAALDVAGMAHCGAGRTDTAARRPVTVPVHGPRVGFLSVMQRYEMYLAEEVYARRGNPGPARLRMTATSRSSRRTASSRSWTRSRTGSPGWTCG